MAAVVLLDTGPLVALMDQREEHHGWAREAFSRRQLPLLTCQPVLTKALFLLSGQPSARAKLLRHVAAGHLVDALGFAIQAPRIAELMECYANVPMSFADASLVAMAEQRPEARICTLDSDFLIDRQHGDKPLALIAPFSPWVARILVLANGPGPQVVGLRQREGGNAQPADEGVRDDHDHDGQKECVRWEW